MAMDFTQARVNMVKSQAVPNMVLDTALLEGLLSVPREDFAFATHRELAYSDLPVPWNDCGRRSLTPLQTGWLIQEMRLSTGDRVLVVGAGSGYECAVLAAMGMEVFALEADAELAARGEKLTDPSRVRWHAGSLDDGWSQAGRYDGILICGAVNAIPAKLTGQLQPDGFLVGIVGRAGEVNMLAVRIPGGSLKQETLFDTVAPLLPGCGQDAGFRL
ncbi:MAG: protein-L-isoaspartate O-methyltransferase [Magnetococcales bacterium]|nr:protein-L-isoaspartate O-methyltransferase [Magnetococcales bacterium]